MLGIINNKRGHISVIDRARLETQSVNVIKSSRAQRIDWNPT